LQISQTRFGASAVLSAGLFHSIKVSGLFTIDPDLGVGKYFQANTSIDQLLTITDIDGPSSVGKHYNLLSAIMRIICAALLSRGAQNEQSLEQGRRFLAENRLPILAVLKKSAGLGSGVHVPEGSANELAEAFMLLIAVSGFLDVSWVLLVGFLANLYKFEEQSTPKRLSLKAFT